MTSKPEIMEKLVMQPASSSYRSLGTSYQSAGHSIEYFPILTITGKDYYDSRAGIPSDQRMSTAAEELAIQLGLERAGQDPRTAEAFNDLFARNDSHRYVWQWTETGLRVPEGRDPTKYETDAHGRKYWARELLIGNNAVGEVLVPEGNGRVAVEWDEVFGLPKITEDIVWPHTPYTTHFFFNKNPELRAPSIYQDVGVFRHDWHLDKGESCISVDAAYERWDLGLFHGFRPVRGSLPEIEKTV